MIERDFLLELLEQIFDQLYIFQLEEISAFGDSKAISSEVFEKTGIRMSCANINPDKRYVEGKLWGICYVMKWDFEQDGNVFRVFTQAKKKMIMEHKVKDLL